MLRHVLACACLPLFALGFSLSAAAADIVVEKTDAGVVVKVGDQPFTTYVFQSKVKPILWPIIGPTGKEMTRAWPMREGNGCGL